MTIELTWLDIDTPVDTFKCTGGVGFDTLVSFLHDDAIGLQTEHLANTIVAMDGQAVVGYMSYGLRSLTLQWEDAERMDMEHQPSDQVPGAAIYYLAVADGYRRQGIGSLLVDYLFQLVSDLRDSFPCRIISVEAFQDAEGFYSRNQFYEACPASQWIADNQDDGDAPPCVLMLADLGPMPKPAKA
jgi:GNAT superfamily N-acetyltransferase